MGFVFAFLDIFSESEMWLNIINFLFLVKFLVAEIMFRIILIFDLLALTPKWHFFGTPFSSALYISAMKPIGSMSKNLIFKIDITAHFFLGKNINLPKANHRVLSCYLDSIWLHGSSKLSLVPSSRILLVCIEFQHT